MNKETKDKMRDTMAKDFLEAAVGLLWHIGQCEKCQEKYLGIFQCVEEGINAVITKSDRGNKEPCEGSQEEVSGTIL